MNLQQVASAIQEKYPESSVRIMFNLDHIEVHSTFHGMLTVTRRQVDDNEHWGRIADFFGAPEPMMQFFAYDHLPLDLRQYSAPFGHLAEWICGHLPRNPERTVALRKLLEAKDCAVRAKIYKSPQEKDHAKDS